jgi:hypothetical protein
VEPGKLDEASEPNPMNQLHSGQPGGARRTAREIYRPWAGWLAGCLALLLLLPRPASSQDALRFVASNIDSSKFPSVHFNLDVYDAQGNFTPDLTPSDLQLSEDGQPVSATNLELYAPDVQFTVAITASDQLAVSLGGQPQLELIRAALLQWISGQPAQNNLDFSFSTNTGLQVIRSHDPQQWAAAINAYQLDSSHPEVNLFSLSTAVDLAADQTVSPQTRRAILLITPPIPAAQQTALDELTSRARSTDVRVFIWVPVSSLEASPPDTAALQSLSDATGGRLSLVAGAETLPGLDSWLQPLRQSYQVQYLSTARTSGDHNLTVSLTGGSADEQHLQYALTLNPPNPIFLSPPAQIERTWTTPEGGEELVLTPQLQPIAMVVEFPDGHTRPLVDAKLYMDGALVQENTSAPFDAFAWDLTSLAESGVHTLRVEVTDSLGLTGQSIDTPITLVVAPRPAINLFERISESGLIAVGAVALAGAVLALVLVGENQLRAHRRRANRRHMTDPVTQPVPIPQDRQSQPRTRRPAGEPGSWPKTVPLPGVPARLIRVTEDEHAVPGSLIPINRSEITLGSDLRQAIILVEDPSVDKLHARLLRGEDGAFLLLD